MLNSLVTSAKGYIKNMPGWRTDRKIIVIESDDWGSIRMPSKTVYNKCLKCGYRVDNIAYERYDSIASEDDLELFFDVLSKYKDKNGNPAVITANILVANPDFKKIKNSNFKKYHFELITETFKKYPRHNNCFNIWKNGIANKVFFPQSHGREHLNVSMFMNALRTRDEDALFGFKHRMPGSIPKGDHRIGNLYVESLKYDSLLDKKEKLNFIIEGLDLFKDLMGYSSESFIPPNYLWNPEFDEYVFAKGVQFYQGNRIMKEPMLDGTIRKHSHAMGETNNLGQKYLVRNAFFEPSLYDSTYDSVDICLKDIDIAFKMKKPAIICSHRLNYVGFIDCDNRDRNLIKLDDLLSRITNRWPDVEFLNSVQLGKSMGN